MKILILVLVILFIIYFNKKEKKDYKFYKLYNTRFKNNFTNNRLNGKLTGIDQVYAITMKNKAERFNNINNLINLLGLNCNYLEAITPKDFKPGEMEEISSVEEINSPIYKKYTRPAVLMSFITTFINSIQNGYSVITIFEDDIKINVGIDTINNATHEFVKSKCDVFFMGYCFLECDQKTKQIGKYLLELNKPEILCGHAICIKTKILPGLIDYCFKMTKPSDELFSDYFVKMGMKVCIPIVPYFDQIERNVMDSLNDSKNILKYCR
jgi:GR25 family glycosyltransferase involved in LPS biosynthesis